MNGVAVLDEKLDAMPKFKKRPIGRTGHRFILEHSFVTKSGCAYSGFSLQFPKVFDLKSEKAKDKAMLVEKRNATLTRWAEVNITLLPEAVDAWVAKLDGQ